MMATPTSRRDFLHQAMIGGAGLGLSCRTGRKRAPKPNVLLIIADDMGYSDAGCYGGEIETPNLDRLAANGLRFTQCYSTGRCWPSRTCLLTGYYPQQVRMDPPQGPLPEWVRTAPDYLTPLGYRCYHSGKWHLMGAAKVIADGHFDRSYVLHDHNRFFTPQLHELDDHALPAVVAGGNFYVTTSIADHAIDFLKEHHTFHRDEPFYSYLAFTSPHFPLQALKEDIDRYRQRFLAGWDVVHEQRWQRMQQMGLVSCGLAPLEPEVTADWSFDLQRLQKEIGPGETNRALAWHDLAEEQKKFQATKMAIHAAMIDRMDQEIGRVLAQIRAMGAEENTIVFFISDNGASAEQIIRGDMNDIKAEPGSAQSYFCLGPGWSSAANTPFRLHKSWVHEGGISSPLIVHWPAGIQARGELRHDPCHFIDLLPTVIKLAGGQEIPRQWNGQTAAPLPGMDLTPAFAHDNAIQHDYIYFHHLSNRAIRQGDWKLVAKGENGPWELYNLQSDRCEQQDLSKLYPERVAGMSAQWQRHEDEFRRQAGVPAENSKSKQKR